MLPQVTEVVLVEEAFVVAEVKVGEVHLVWVGAKTHAIDAADAIVFPTDAKPMPVRISLAHSNLQGEMEISDRAVAADQEPPPDHGRDPAQPDVELIDLYNR
jgi:hypothetical protein